MNLLHSLLSTSRGKPGMSLLVLFALIFSGCGGGGGTTTPPPPPATPTLTSIAISPTAAIIKKAATTSYTATGTYSDGSTDNITSTVTWTSSLPSVAMITAGVATGEAAGTTTITASYGGKTSPDAALTVITLNSIAIIPATATVSTGSTTSFTATGTYSNGTTENITSQVVWSDSASGFATINSSTGVATSIAAGGPTTITATATGSASGTSTLTVTNTALTSITISPTTPSVAKGVPATFTATGNIGDVSGSVTWASSNTTVATINASGIATTLGEGVTTITATASGATNNSATLTVTAPVLATLAITPTPASVAVGYTRQFTVSGTLTDGTAANATHWNPLAWTSSNTAVAANPVTGLATGGTTLGTTNITATAAGPITSNISVLTVALSQMGGARQGLPMTPAATVTTLAGAATSGYVDNTGTLASFYGPASVTTDGTNLYVADTANHTIRKIVIASGVVSTLAGAATYSGNSDGTGSNAKFNLPEGITTDGTNLYVADYTNNRIRQIAPNSGTLSGMTSANAVVTTLAGSGSLGSTDGTGTAATFSNPRGITADGSGNLYVADSASNKIRKIVIATQAVSTLTPALVAPRGITTDGTNLYVANTGDSTIRKIVIATQVASTLATGSGLNAPRGITTDGTNLFVANTEGNTILKIAPSSGTLSDMTSATAVVTTLAGSGTASSVNGSGTGASFNLPHGITTDGTSLFVVDNGGHKIRQID